MVGGDNHGVRVLCFPEAVTPAGLRRQVVVLRRQAWPSDAHDEVVDDRPIHDPALDPQTMLLVDGQRVIGALGILSKRIVHDGRWFQASGLTAVVVTHDLRRHGFGYRLVTAAHRFVAASGVDLSVFTCDCALQGFYERAGWCVLPGSVIIGGTPKMPFTSDQPGFDKVTVADFFSTEATLHRATFVQSRIHLYPGETDRLW